MKTQLTKGAAVLSVAAVASLLQALPASAYSIDNVAKSITFTLGDPLPELFTVEFDGNVEGEAVPGLASKANVQLTAFTANSATFIFDLFSTPSGDVSSARVSALGFNVSPALSGASVSGDFANAFRANNPANPGNSNPSSLPNGVGSLDVCFGSGSNCRGGAGFGATPGNPISFTAILSFIDPVEEFTLSNFAVRYQSIVSTLDLGSDSGTGTGTPIPTPALLPGLVGLGVAALRKRRGNAEDQEAA
ncbi:hypothetical protein C7293_10620 [filamentous cyanobacterium CCT1]|nr:hypothetical protein C7293_10620 [filamentous cyanobacterium CCT1]PSN76810.1 hypothetical protein C8B47_25380 [filamentous cyanobacterium CCP4]